MDFNSRPNSRDSQQAVTSPQNHFYHHSPNQPFDQLAGQQLAPSGGQYSADYVQQYNLYVQNYYREYYSQWMTQHNRRHLSSATSQTAAPTLKQPLKYGSRRCHARAVFSQHNNQLIVLDNTCAHSKPLHVYSLQDLFVDYLYPNLQILLRADHLPFSTREACLQFVRQEVTSRDLELKLILRIIQMILKSRERITGLDLSELLFERSNHEILGKDFVYSENADHVTALNTYRTLLMRGLKSVALNTALSSGLMDHALTLSFLMDLEKKKSREDNDLMVKTIRKFCDSLRADDPIYVFYNSVLNRFQRKHVFLELSFDSFLALLSNDEDLTSVSVESQEFPHLLPLVKSLVSGQEDDHFLLSDQLFDSEFDALLVNECLEFALLGGNSFKRKLVEKKVKFVSVLFDFGFISASLKYSQQLKTLCFDDVTRRLVKEIESRFAPQESDVIDSEPISADQSEQSVSNEDLSAPITNPVTFSGPISVGISSPISPTMSSPMSPQSVPLPEPEIAPPLLLPVLSEVDIPFSFVSHSNHMNNEFQENGETRDTTDDSRTSTLDERTTVETTTEKKPNQSSGFLRNLFQPFKSKNQAILPDDSKMTLKYDESSKQWVDTSAQPNGSVVAPTLRPPPVMGAPVGSGGGRGGHQWKKQRYVATPGIKLIEK